MRPKKAIVAAFTAALLITSVSGPSAEQQLQAAIHREVVVGDLKGAIEQFEKIASTTRDRSLAAKALMHAAGCYEKLGTTKAREYYQRVAKEYADQKESATRARAWLTRTGSGVAERTVTARRLWAGEDADTEGAPSPDGRYLSFVDWTTRGNIAIRDLETGEKRLLTQNAGAEFGYQAVSFSPDGKRVAYLWCCKNEMRISNVDGSNIRVLHRSADSAIFPFSWSPDAKTIAGVMTDYSDQTSAIVLVSTVDGTMQRLKSGKWSWPHLGSFSPDGRFITYAAHSGASSPGGVFVLAVDGSAEHALVEGPADFRTPAWSPDGKTIVFPSDRSGVMGLWAVGVNEGKPQGSPELVKAGVGDAIGMRFTKDGSYFYGTRDRQRHVYVADFDGNDLRLVSNPAILSNECFGCNGGSAFSPDGKHIAFTRTVGEKVSFVVRSVADGKERVLPNRFEQPYFATRNGVQWIDNERFLVVDTLNGRRKFWGVNAETGEAKLLLDGDSRTWPPSAFSPDGKFMYYSAGEKGEGSLTKLRLLRRNLETGEEQVLHRQESTGIGFFGIAVSPSGEQISFMANTPGAEKRSLYVMPAQGGTVREIYKGSYEDPRPASAIWSRDGRYILAAAGDYTKHTGVLKAYPVDGGEPRIIDPKVPVEGIFAPSLSPDGKRLVFSGTRVFREIWVVNNLIPEVRASR